MTSDPLALPIGITGITVGYMFGTTRLAALLIQPWRFRMPTILKWVLVDNPRPRQPYGRLWAFIGDRDNYGELNQALDDPLLQRVVTLALSRCRV